jgi:hypothetical protein
MHAEQAARETMSWLKTSLTQKLAKFETAQPLLSAPAIR